MSEPTEPLPPAPIVSDDVRTAESFPMPATSGFRAYLQLLRAPNVFTAMADVLLGFLLTHDQFEPFGQLALLLGSSSLLYLAGMVLNDVYDQAQDARERPHRPIPSGRVPPLIAWYMGWQFLACGAALGWLAAAVIGSAVGGWRAGLVSTLLAGAVVLYDRWLKRTPLAALGMGFCRFLNVLLGLSAASGPWLPMHWCVASAVGVYIVGVTQLARTEAKISSRPKLAFALVLIIAGLAIAWYSPRLATGDELPSLRLPDNWNLFWLLLAGLIGARCVRAVIDPQPSVVQAAVKHCIFSLIILDAGMAVAVQPFEHALVILALLAPTMLLGRWLYAT